MVGTVGIAANATCRSVSLHKVMGMVEQRRNSKAKAMQGSPPIGEAARDFTKQKTELRRQLQMAGQMPTMVEPAQDKVAENWANCKDSVAATAASISDQEEDIGSAAVGHN